MCFGPYPSTHIFRIENSKAYIKISKCLPIAEFWLLRDKAPPEASQHVFIVEAKSSSPNPRNHPDFDDYLNDIRDKLTNALVLGIGLCTGLHKNGNDELPTAFAKLDLTTVDIKLVLIINGHKEAWLVPLKDALKKKLYPIVKMLGLSPTSIIILNHEQAESNQFISGVVPCP